MHVATSPSPKTPLALLELPPQKLGARDVRVRVHAIGVNPVDWKMRSGGMLGTAQRVVGPSGPLVVGVDFAGEVVEAGPESDLAVGDRVVGGTDFSRKQYGSYADEVVVQADQCAKLTDGVSYEQAACLPVAGVTAWVALTKLSHVDETRDARVLVLGASGGVGLMALQLTKMLGGSAVGVCSGRNVRVVEDQGAIAIDYTLGDALEAAAEHGPYQLVLHTVGTDSYPLGKCRQLLSPTGVVTLVAIRPADYLCVTFCGNVNTVLGRPNRETLAPLVAGVERGDLNPIIAGTYALADAEQAHLESMQGKVVGKLLLLP